MHIGQCGVSCIAFSTRQGGAVKTAALPLGPALKQLRADVVAALYAEVPQGGNESFLIGGAGEYDVAGFSFFVLPLARKKDRWIQALVLADGECRACVLSPVAASLLKDEHVDRMGAVDVLVYAVPGSQEKEAEQGLEAVHQIEPRVFIPFGAPETVSAILKSLGVRNAEKLSRFSCKSAQKEEDAAMKVMVLG